MRVLLIGKYPPCQGGISAKTWWLFRALEERGVSLDVVTLVPDTYRSADSGQLPGDVRLRVVKLAEPPWFLPGSDTLAEQLLAAALQLAQERPPDLVEVNYLVPFGVVGAAAARILGVPLLLRHAGSDLAKLGTWPPAHLAIRGLLRTADLVISPEHGVAPTVESLLADARLVRLPRYTPDPGRFAPIAARPSVPTLLFAGKINYHWRLKALDSLFAALADRPRWRLLALAGGRGAEAVRAEAGRRGVADRIDWHDFVPPVEMPAWMARTTAVWAVERPGGVVDFSNLLSEALAMQRSCLVSEATAARPAAAHLLACPGLTTVDPEDPESVCAALDRAASANPPPPPSNLEASHSAYVEANLTVYRKLAGPRPRRQALDP